MVSGLQGRGLAHTFLAFFLVVCGCVFSGHFFLNVFQEIKKSNLSFFGQRAKGYVSFFADPVARSGTLELCVCSFVRLSRRLNSTMDGWVFGAAAAAAAPWAQGEVLETAAELAAVVFQA